MNNVDDHGPGLSDHPAQVRIGTPERRSAQDALEVHLAEKRLESADFERRIEACDRAGTQAELLRIFVDLPPPHPEMPSAPTAEDHEDMPPVAWAGCLALGLGLPVAVVLGLVYGTWWALAVPVAVTVAMTFIEQLRSPPLAPMRRTGPPEPE